MRIELWTILWGSKHKIYEFESKDPIPSHKKVVTVYIHAVKNWLCDEMTPMGTEVTVVHAQEHSFNVVEACFKNYGVESCQELTVNPRKNTDAAWALRKVLDQYEENTHVDNIC